MLDPNTKQLRLLGRIKDVSRSASGNTVFVIHVRNAPQLLKGSRRNRFFGHIAACISHYPDLRRGDLVSFTPESPSKPGQLPRASQIVRIRKADGNF